MFKRNPGRFNYLITLLKPGEITEDELGGITTGAYEAALTLPAMCEQRRQTRQEVIGDYITADTRYFVTRDISGMLPEISINWRIQYNDVVYVINEVTKITESRPYFIQFVATAVNKGGGII